MVGSQDVLCHYLLDNDDCDGQAILTLHLSVGHVILFPYTGMDKTSLDTSSGSLFVRECGCLRMSTSQSNVDLQNYVRRDVD